MPGIDVKKKETRIRVEDPSHFDKRSFRYHTNPSGCSAELVACPRGHYNPRSRKCNVGTRTQAYRLKRKCYPTKGDAQRWVRKNVCARRPSASVCRVAR